MSKGMLGKLPLSAIRGPRDAFEEMLAGEHGPECLEAFKRFIRKHKDPWWIDYRKAFAAAIDACGCDHNHWELTVETFNEDIFGTLGEGYELGQPPMTELAKQYGYWNDREIDAWHASADVAGRGLEASYLVDLARYGEMHPDEQQLGKAIVCWRAGKNGRVAGLYRFHDGRHFAVGGRRDYYYTGVNWFLLRKVKTSTDAVYTARFKAAIEGCACDSDSSELNVETFGEDVFGTLGEGYVLAQPPKSKAIEERGHWTDREIDIWLANEDVADRGLEAAYLVDLAKYGEMHPDEQLTKAIVCWRAGKDDRVACLLSDESMKRILFVRGRRYAWSFGCWFLLRKIRRS